MQSSAQATARESRLKKKRDDEALRRATFKSNATPREIEAQREYERNKKKKQLASETPEQREARLQRNRDYKARIRSTEGNRIKSPAVSYTREYDRNQRRIQRERETLQQKEERLQKAREYKETYKPKATRKEKDASRERMAAMRANWTDEQIANDREVARQRMANVRSRQTVDERNMEKDKQRERRMGEPTWRRKEYERWGEKAWEERELKLASGKWQVKENSYDLEATDPDSLEWHCPAGPNCTCHNVRTCVRCRRYFYGCQALCPSKVCREREEQERVEQEREEEERETSLKDQDEISDNPKPGTSRQVPLYSYAPIINIPAEMSAYDKVRQKNIEERQRKFRELGLKEAKAKFK